MGKWYERIGRVCPVCWGKFRVTPSSAKKYCSGGCWNTMRSSPHLRRRRRRCKTCGEEFKPKRITANSAGVYCSRECWYKRGKGAHTSHNRIGKACPVCWGKFQVIPSSTKTYCSKECWNTMRSAPHLRRREQCKTCGKEFRPQRTNDPGVYCSRECVWEDKSSDRPEWFGKASSVYPTTCRQCGEWFTARSSQAMWCSWQCGERGRYEAPTYECRECGDIFKPEYGSKRRVYCSEVCAKRGSRGPRKHRKRAAKYGVPYEPVRRSDIFERDGYQCQGCGRKTRPDWKPGHDLYPHLDHIVPLSRGGGHVPRNLQTLCRACNIAKSDGSLGSQLLLIA